MVALHVDHGLQPQSRGWSAFAAETAGRLGAGFAALAWTGEKPTRGLAAAARRARHALLAEAARALGASVVVLGHTADDLVEAALMRGEGARQASLGAWRPSPVWPEGRGVMLFRPLLCARRADIRAALSAGGHAWIEDPANVDLAQPRARARASADPNMAVPPPEPDCPGGAALAGEALIDDLGSIRFERRRLLGAPRPAAQRALAAAVLSAGGGERPPRRESVIRLLDRLATGGAVAATLAGAKVTAPGDEVIVARDAGEAARGGLRPVPLAPNGTIVWDGRFELRSRGQAALVRALGGVAATLDRTERERLAEAHAPIRPGLPVVERPDGTWTCPIFARDLGVEACSLVGGRFLAACGAEPTETAAKANVTVRARGETATGALSSEPTGSLTI